jgi:hypothetical protein
LECASSPGDDEFFLYENVCFSNKIACLLSPWGGTALRMISSMLLAGAVPQQQSTKILGIYVKYKELGV